MEKKEGASIPTWAFGAVIAIMLAGIGALITVGGDKANLAQVQGDLGALESDTKKEFERVDGKIDTLAKESREADDRIGEDMRSLEGEARTERQRIDERLRQHELGKQH